MQKKFLKLSIALSMLMLSSSAFAVTVLSGADEDPTVIGGANFKVSTGVILIASASDTAYSVITKNTNGDKTYQATSEEPSVVVGDSAVGTVLGEGDAVTLPGATE